MTLWHERPISPMLAQTGKAFNSENFIFEPKWDGLRTLLFLNNQKLELQNRNLRDITRSYPELQTVKSCISEERTIIDGEIIVLNHNGLADFGRLQNRFGILDHKVHAASKLHPTTFAAFDILHVNGKDLLNIPLIDRKQLLKNILLEGPHLLVTEHVEKAGIEFYERARNIGLEGTIAKERHSPYLRGTRSGLWVKIKGTKTIDCIVVGFTPGEGRRERSFGSLVLALYDRNGKLVHAGNVGGGFSDQELEKIKRNLTTIVVDAPVLRSPIEPYQKVTWVRPILVVEVEYAMMTADKRLRFPRFHRLRPDKRPTECRWE